MVVSGTIAPSRELPELSAEETIRIILSNLNLVVPVVAALLVIIIAIVVICVLRSKGNHHKGTIATNYLSLFLFLFSPIPMLLPTNFRTTICCCCTRHLMVASDQRIRLFFYFVRVCCVCL